MRYIHFALALLAGASLAACGGGGGGASSIVPATSPQAANRHLVVSFAGASALSSARRPMAIADTAVSVTFNGAIVGSGKLDSSGQASIEIESAIPPGATLLITAGSLSASIVWNQTSEDAAVLISVHADGTMTVTVVSGDEPQASPAPDDPNGETSDEDGHGNASSIDQSDGNAALPANLPIAVTPACSTITIAPKDSRIASLRFEENIEDGEGGSRFKYEGPFTQSMSFPLVAQSARIEIRVFDASGQELLDVKAPIGAFTAVPGQATPSPCPAASSTPAPSASPSADP